MGRLLLQASQSQDGSDHNRHPLVALARIRDSYVQADKGTGLPHPSACPDISKGSHRVSRAGEQEEQTRSDIPAPVGGPG